MKPRGITGGPVLLYDGECGLCGAVVRWLLRRDAEGRLRFAALQGRFGQAALSRLGLPTRDFDSLVFLPDADGAAAFLRTDGALAVLETLGGGCGAAARIGRVVPARIRDAAYRVVARARHRLWSRGRSEGMPAAHAARFLA